MNSRKKGNGAQGSERWLCGKCLEDMIGTCLRIEFIFLLVR